MLIRKASTTFALAAVLLSLKPALAESTLRIAMTAADVPTATGLPNNGFEGMRFLGYPVFEALVLWDLTRTDQLAGLPKSGSLVLSQPTAGSAVPLSRPTSPSRSMQ